MLAVALALAGVLAGAGLERAHGWASFAFQGDRAMGLRFRPLLPLQTLAGEALFVLPWLWVPMMIAFVRAFRGAAGRIGCWRGWRRRRSSGLR